MAEGCICSAARTSSFNRALRDLLSEDIGVGVRQGSRTPEHGLARLNKVAL